MKRRIFCQTLAGTGCLLGTGGGETVRRLLAFQDVANLSHVEARYYRKLPDREIECLLCPRLCRLGDKERGYCGVRQNDGGTYYTLVYGKACSANVDPIEKKPFFHFLPGSDAFSIATAGCNVNCKFCQNWQISQVRPEQIPHHDLPPEDVALAAQKYRCASIAYTYTEPIVFFEYMYDSSLAGRRRGIKNCVVTGGHIRPEPLRNLLQVVDAVKIDLKAFRQDFYTDFVRGELQPVLDAIREVHESKVWLEIVYLVIPTLNDSVKDIESMCRWLRREIGPDVPLHFSRFVPMYLMKNLPPTPLSTLEALRAVAIREGLHYVYIGNVPGHKGENTECPRCGKTVIERFGLQLKSLHLEKGRCRFCGLPIPGIWA
ncbi:MAG: AmmeMemoRadiSam system radical SAM enzyme [Candidatus Aminicenantes bacterium]|nr:AmmeMemoRadiSam system radical SAM enzyme [Candidatus Aminicenantes bacterium]